MSIGIASGIIAVACFSALYAMDKSAERWRAAVMALISVALLGLAL